MDSRIPESLAIKQTKQEMETPECILRLKAHQEKVKLDRAEKQSKKSTRFNYE